MELWYKSKATSEVIVIFLFERKEFIKTAKIFAILGIFDAWLGED